MRYVQFLGNEQVEVREGAAPEPEPGEALVRIAVSAICGSELSAYRGAGRTGQQHNPGHEMAGTVVQANGTCRVAEGQRVGVQVLAGCGACLYCLRGDPKHCIEGSSFLQNGHSEYVVAPETCLIPLPDELDWETAVLVCGDTLGTPYRALQRLGGVQAAQTAAVFGCGPIGLGCLTWLHYFGLRTIVSEPHPYRRALAEQLGADLVLDPGAVDVIEAIHDETGGGADVCLDCSPEPQTLVDALEAARVFGRVGWIGEKALAEVSPSRQVIHKELIIGGSWYFTAADFHEELAHYERGLRVRELITHRYPLEEAPQAYRQFASRESGKVVLQCGSRPDA
jgi:threonine dehydrogenase-like Zn-dependent dehydrogenase